MLSNSFFTIAHTVSRSPSGRCFPSSRYSTVSETFLGSASTRRAARPMSALRSSICRSTVRPHAKATATSASKPWCWCLRPRAPRGSANFSLHGMAAHLDARSRCDFFTGMIESLLGLLLKEAVL